MKNTTASEKAFLKAAIIRNVYPTIEKQSELVLGELRSLESYNNFTTAIKVAASVHGAIFFNEKEIRYDRFNLADYKPSVHDKELTVPASKVNTPLELINYMNEQYLNTYNVKERTPLLFRGFQIVIYLEDVEPFTISNPVIGNTLSIKAKSNSYIFEGSLLIKFV